MEPRTHGLTRRGPTRRGGGYHHCGTEPLSRLGARRNLVAFGAVNGFR